MSEKPCERCGHCPTCGRSNARPPVYPQPYNPWYPVLPTTPYPYRWWYGGSTSGGSAAGPGVWGGTTNFSA